MQWYASERLGPTRSLTPEGYLLCENVPVARTGPMLYAAGEVPVTPTADGLIRIMRQPEDVFDPVAMASYNGKPVVLDHPAKPVTIDSWKRYAVGTMFNTRRGVGLKDDYLFADLLITDPAGVMALRDSNPEVSCGYDAEYDTLAPGRGRQHKIVGNHLAIVTKGRCGPQCSIGDSEMTVSVLDRVRAAFRTNDMAAFDAAMGELTGAPAPAAAATDPAAGGAATAHPHRIVVNVHGGGASSGAADASPAAAAAPAPGTQAGAATTPPPAVSPSEGGAGSIDQRLAAIEQQLTIIVAAMNGGGEEEEEAPGGGAPATQEGGGTPAEGEAAPAGKKTFGGDEEDDTSAASNNHALKEDMTPPGNGKGDLTKANNQGKTPGMLGDGIGGGVNSTKDSANLMELYQDAVSRAEILFPGLKPKATYDAKATSTSTVDCICDLQRRALEGAMGVERTKKILTPLVGDTKVAKITNDMLGMLFKGASELVRASTNVGMIRSKVVAGDQGSKGIPSIADIAKRNDEFWRSRGAA